MTCFNPTGHSSKGDGVCVIMEHEAEPCVLRRFFQGEVRRMKNEGLLPAHRQQGTEALDGTTVRNPHALSLGVDPRPCPSILSGTTGPSSARSALLSLRNGRIRKACCLKPQTLDSVGILIQPASREPRGKSPPFLELRSLHLPNGRATPPKEGYVLTE